MRGAIAAAAASSPPCRILGGPGGAGAGQPLEQVRVDSVEVRGNQRWADDAVLSAAGVRLGDRITYREIQDAIRRLWATNQFSDVRCGPSRPTPTTPSRRSG
jgi:outer membrane protein assembly factor BamA